MISHDATLAAVSARVLEDLCFHWVDPDSSPSAEGLEPLCASVGFSGPWRGRMLLSIDKTLLGELAANLLGSDETSEADGPQALLELANVLCGNILPEVDSVRSAFELSSPEVVEGSSLSEGDAVVASAVLDAGKVVVQLLRESAS